MVHCSVPFCTSNKSKKDGTSFHEYPAEESLRLKWIKAVSRKDENSSKLWKPSDWSVVCSKHFLESDYKPGLKKRILIRNAVPSVFPEYPSYKQIVCKEARREVKKVSPKKGVCTGTKRKHVQSEQQVHDQVPLMSPVDGAVFLDYESRFSSSTARCELSDCDIRPSSSAS
ncbi:THAP domain-containing protein 1-like, partial [Centruroides vittatus]